MAETNVSKVFPTLNTQFKIVLVKVIFKFNILQGKTKFKTNGQAKN